MLIVELHLPDDAPVVKSSNISVKKIQILLPAQFINKRHQDIFTQFITWAAIASAYSLSPSAWSPDFSNPFTSNYSPKK